VNAEQLATRPRAEAGGEERSRAETVTRALASAVARLRHGRAMHPRGLMVGATLDVLGAREHGVGQQASEQVSRQVSRHGVRGIGVPVLDEPGVHQVVARLSKGGSLPGALPDVLGLAVRLPGPLDVLLSTCGAVPWLLRPRTSFTAGPYSSLAPYETDAGPVWIVAWPEGPPVPADPALLPHALRRGPLLFRLRAVSRDGSSTVATLRVHTPLPDVDVAFDPVLNDHPSLRQRRWLRRLRRSAYLGSRQARGAEVEQGPRG